MATRYINFAEGEFYHVYNRGVDKRTIYQETRDYVRFQELLYLSNTNKPTSIRNAKREHRSVYEVKRSEPLVAVGAYCLMPNHFHLLITPLVENGLSTFMNKITTGYAMYFNKKYSRSGTLFQGNFKAQHIADDQYLKYLYSYINLNPVKLIQSDWKENGIHDVTQAFEYIKNYAASSAPDLFKVGRIENKILESKYFPSYFDSTNFSTELLEWLTYDPSPRQG